MKLGVVRVCQHRDGTVPISVVIGDIMSDSRYERAVLSSDLAVRFRVIRRSGKLVHLKECAYWLEDSGDERQPVIG